MRVKRLDPEIFQVMEQKLKNNDWSVQLIQKAMLGTCLALAPILEMMLKKRKTDPEHELLG